MAHSTLRGVPQLKRQLEAVITEDKMRRGILVACEYRAEQAQARYAAFNPQYPGDGSVGVLARARSGASAELVATGPSVAFIEYGSGIKGHTFGRHAAMHGFTPGSWSVGHKNAIRHGGSRDGMWVYSGQGGGDAEPVKKNGSAIRPGFWWTTGNDGANVMADEADLHLKKEVVDRVRRMIRE